MFTSAARAQNAFVRVNQVGYVSGASKRAYLMASASESGATFSLKNSSGTTVFGPAAIGAKLGSWSGSDQTFYYQVAVASGGHNYVGDHDIWRLPQADDDYQNCVSPYEYICHRPVFINTASISPNLAGRLAADFALCYHVFASSNPTYANQCLTSAEHVFDLANTAPSGNLLTAGPYDFYPEIEWRDDLELGATELYFAIQGCGTSCPINLHPASYYLGQAAQWANAYITGPNDAADTLNLYDVSGLAHFELYRALALAGIPSGLATTQARLLCSQT